jgi:hypothetical protein
MDGIYVNIDGKGWVRPRSKKEIREIVSTNPKGVRIERTSLFGSGNDSDDIVDLPSGKQVTFVGPDPYNRRNFYGTLVVSEDAFGNKRFTVK